MIYEINPSMSINEVIQKCQKGDKIKINKGIYKEKIIVDKSDIEIIGEGKDLTIIENKDYFHKIMPDFNEANTFRTYTLYVSGDNVKISNLTIKNISTPSSIYGQAVALYVDGNHFEADNVKLQSAQDTLFCGPLPKDLIERYSKFLLPSQLRGKESIQKYHKCEIYGDIDFIFGCGTVLFDECDIISINRGDVDIDGYISAPSHYAESKFGFVFYKCNLKAENGVKNVFLARPWRDYGYSAFIDCNVGNHINKEGFSKWQGNDRHLHARFIEYNENVDQSNRISFTTILDKNKKETLLKEFLEYVK